MLSALDRVLTTAQKKLKPLNLRRRAAGNHQKMENIFLILK